MQDQPLDTGTGFTLSLPVTMSTLQDRTVDLEKRLAQLALTVENLLKEVKKNCFRICLSMWNLNFKTT